MARQKRRKSPWGRHTTPSTKATKSEEQFFTSYFAHSSNPVGKILLRSWVIFTWSVCWPVLAGCGSLFSFLLFQIFAWTKLFFYQTIEIWLIPVSTQGLNVVSSWECGWGKICGRCHVSRQTNAKKLIFRKLEPYVGDRRTISLSSNPLETETAELLSQYHQFNRIAQKVSWTI